MKRERKSERPREREIRRERERERAFQPGISDCFVSASLNSCLNFRKLEDKLLTRCQRSFPLAAGVVVALVPAVLRKPAWCFGAFTYAKTFKYIIYFVPGETSNLRAMSVASESDRA